MTREFNSAEFGADSNVINDLSGCRGLVNTTNKMDEYGLTASGSSDDTNDLSFGYLKIDVVQNPY